MQNLGEGVMVEKKRKAVACKGSGWEKGILRDLRKDYIAPLERYR